MSRYDNNETKKLGDGRVVYRSKIYPEIPLRDDDKYDLLIPISYNRKNTKVGLGSCIFMHLTRDYKPTAGCIALKKKDFLIMLKLIKRNTKIKIS